MLDRLLHWNQKVVHTSSHQFSVEVTGFQYPCWSGGGYGYEGSHEGMVDLGCVPQDVVETQQYSSRTYHLAKDVASPHIITDITTNELQNKREQLHAERADEG